MYRADLYRDLEPNRQYRTRLIPRVPNQTRQKDYVRAGIELVDEEGRHADLHGLRATLGTKLARGGVTPQVGRQLMRHANYATTLKHYTLLGLSDFRGALFGLAPVIAPKSGEERQLATGTHGSKPQQIPQQSGHDSVRKGACRCDSKGQPGEGQLGTETRAGPSIDGTLGPEAGLKWRAHQDLNLGPPD